MIKKTIKYFLYFLILISIGIFYLSYYGIETNKFNQIIKDKISENSSKIDIELKITDLKSVKPKLSSLKNKYIKIIRIDIIIIFIKVVTCVSFKKTFLLPFKNFIYAINGKLPNIINNIAVISIFA